MKRLLLLTCGGVVLIIVVVSISIFLSRDDADIESYSNINPDSNSKAHLTHEKPPMTQNTPIGLDRIEKTDNLTQQLLTAEEALMVAQEWLDTHAVQDIYFHVLRTDYYSNISHDDIDYYQYFHTEPEMDWFSILVNVVSGDLYYMYVSNDVNNRLLSIEPLDVWWHDWSYDPGCIIDP